MKHLLPPEFASQSISVALAGAGGNGSQMLTGLARMHVALLAVGHRGLDVCVFDPDTVTPANVGRQLFSPSDVGANKAAVLVNRVNLYYNLDWNATPCLYKAGARWSDQRADVLIGCVDSAAARRDLAQTRFKYWLDLGNTDKKGQVILGTRVRAKRNESRPRLVTEIFPELKNKKLKEDSAPSCSLAQALERQDLFINQAVSTFALQLLWQFIRNGGLDIHGYFINLESGRVTPLPIK
jgi:PRTRC genetic system ThiF family protein